MDRLHITDLEAALNHWRAVRPAAASGALAPEVAALAEVIVAARRRGEDIGTDLVLARYQDWRRPDATALAFGMDGVNTLFSNANPVLRAARELGMGLVDAIPPLRRGFMRQAAGLSLAPMPRLLTGQRL